MIRLRRSSLAVASGLAAVTPTGPTDTEQEETADKVKLLDDVAKSILVQEHASLRAEILGAYGYAQSIVRWTLATFAAVSAAGLVAVYNASNNNNQLLFNIALLLFGAGVPGIVWLNAWTWLGELYRAERAGSYLRHLEADVAAMPGLTARLGFQPARWETFIWSNRRTKTLWGKQTMTYLGTAGVFFGAAGGSLFIFFIVWHQMLINSQLEALVAVGHIAASIFITLAGLIGCVAIFRRLTRLGDAVAPVEPTYASTEVPVEP